MPSTYVDNKSEFDLLSLKRDKMAKLQKLAYVSLFSRYSCTVQNMSYSLKGDYTSTYG